MKTDRAKANEKRVMNRVNNYDPNLRLRFNRKNNFYYITTPSNCPLELEQARLEAKKNGESAFFEDSLSPYGEATRNKELVVIVEIPIRLIESEDSAVANILKHLKENDMKGFASTHKSRVSKAEQMWDYHRQSEIDRTKNFSRDEIRALGRDIWRGSRATARFAGLKRMEGTGGQL